MNKKLLGVATLTTALVALSAGVQAAGAAQWFSDGKLIPVGKVEPVATKAKLTVTLRAPTGAPIGTIKCKVKNKETIQNGPNGGTDEITAIKFTGCKGKPSPCAAGAVAIVPLNLPWPSSLVAGPPIKDEIDMALEVKCGGALFSVYEGTLKPEVGKSVLVFGPGSGMLSAPAAPSNSPVATNSRVPRATTRSRRHSLMR